MTQPKQAKRFPVVELVLENIVPIVGGILSALIARCLGFADYWLLVMLIGMFVFQMTIVVILIGLAKLFDLIYKAKRK